MTNSSCTNFISFLPHGKITSYPIPQTESQNHYESRVSIKQKQSQKFEDSQLFNVICNQPCCAKIKNRFNNRMNYSTWLIEHHNINHPSVEPSFIIVSFWSTIWQKRALHTEYRLVSLNNLQYLKPKSKSFTTQTSLDCDWCALKNIKLSLCSGCNIMRYCSKQCQQNHWKLIHKQFCKLFRQRGNLSMQQKSDCRKEETVYMQKLARDSSYMQQKNSEWVNLRAINRQKQQPKEDNLLDREDKHALLINTQIRVIIDAFGGGDKKLNFENWCRMVNEFGMCDKHYPGGLFGFWCAMCEELGLIPEYLPSLNNGIYGMYIQNKKVKPILFGPKEIVETCRNIAYMSAMDRGSGSEIDYGVYSEKAYQKGIKLLMELYGHAQGILFKGEASFDEVCEAIISCFPFFDDKNLLGVLYNYSSIMGPSKQIEISWHKIRWNLTEECQEGLWDKYDIDSDNMLYDLYYICKLSENGYRDYMLNIQICDDVQHCEDKIKMCNNGCHVMVDAMEKWEEQEKWCLGTCAAYIPSYSFKVKQHGILIWKVLQLFELNPKLCHSIYVGREVQCGYKEKEEIVKTFNEISGANALWRSHKKQDANIFDGLMDKVFPFM
eukprot:440832_1